MAKYSWVTDIHLDHIRKPEIITGFLQSLKNLDSDYLLITGDTCDGTNLIRYLKVLASYFKGSLLVTLGNHDYWDSSFSKMADDLNQLNKEEPRIIWMNSVDYIKVNDNLTIIGADGWYDGWHGDAWGSNVYMNDWSEILDFRFLNKPDRLVFIKEHARKEAKAMYDKGLKALAETKGKVIAITHFPPYPEASTYRGKQSDSDYLPWFCSKAMGETFDYLAQFYPERQIEVLCGHSHGAATVQVKSNLLVRCGGARYGFPTIQETVEVSDIVVDSAVTAVNPPTT